MKLTIPSVCLSTLGPGQIWASRETAKYWCEGVKLEAVSAQYLERYRSSRSGAVFVRYRIEFALFARKGEDKRVTAALRVKRGETVEAETEAKPTVVEETRRALAVALLEIDYEKWREMCAGPTPPEVEIVLSVIPD